MKIRIASDIHLEFADYTVPALDGDQETMLVLAGDVGLVHKANLSEVYIPFLRRAAAQFREVVLIMGNHEHYGGSFVKTYDKLKAAIDEAGLTTVNLLEKQTRVVDDVAFVGATLWTNCDNFSPHAPYLFHGMSDSRVIRTGPRDDPYGSRFSAQASWTDHAKAVVYIGDEVAKHRADGKRVVVVTHHAPSWLSIHQRYAGQAMNMFYASDLSGMIQVTEPNLWVHGHTHHQFDYSVHNTRILANPRGYYGHEDTSGFDQTLVVEV